MQLDLDISIPSSSPASQTFECLLSPTSASKLRPKPLLKKESRFSKKPCHFSKNKTTAANSNSMERKSSCRNYIAVKTEDENQRENISKKSEEIKLNEKEENEEEKSQETTQETTQETIKEEKSHEEKSKIITTKEIIVVDECDQFFEIDSQVSILDQQINLPGNK